MKLLEQLKRYLNISYEDQDTDEMLKDILENGKAIINDYAGTELDYEQPGQARQLLFDYCRYARSHATEMFEVNFRRDLMGLREMTEVQYHADHYTDSFSDL